MLLKEDVSNELQGKNTTLRVVFLWEKLDLIFKGKEKKWKEK